MAADDDAEILAILSEEDMALLRGREALEGERLREAIARRAYELYQRRGGAHGRDLDDWLQAERELTRSSRA